MTLRLHLDPAAGDTTLRPGVEIDLPPGPARHVQVLRLQPGAALVVFDGRGGEWRAEVLRMGHRDVRVVLTAHEAVERELPVAVTLAVGMPANERMDFLVEKATELGVCALQPLVCERSVLRLSGERAERRRQHWQSVAIAAAEQCGRTRVPVVHPVRAGTEWLAGLPAASAGEERRVLSLTGDAQTAPPAGALATAIVLSGPEGGLTPAEEAAARRSAGFSAWSLGPRILRADTAPLAALVHLGAGSRPVDPG